MKLKDKFIYRYAQIFGRNRFFKLNYLLIRLGLSGIGINNYYDFNISGENHFKNFILKKYKLKTIFDVGCNEGNYITPFLKSEAEIHCFEPHPETSERLKNRYADNPKIIVNPIGLSDKKEDTFIYDYEDVNGSSHASLFEENITEVQNRPSTKTKISLDLLDSYVVENGIETIDLLKIDTEGNEIFVLKGAENTLKGNKIKIIQFEFSALNISGRSFFKDFTKALSGYNLYRLLPNGFFPLDYSKQAMVYEQYAFQNVVAFRKDIDILPKVSI